MDELPACDLPGAVRGDGDQGVAAGVIAASLQIELVRHLWRDMKLVGDIAVEARHQHIRQIIDRSYGLSSLHASDPAIADPGPEGRRRSGGRARRSAQGDGARGATCTPG